MKKLFIFILAVLTSCAVHKSPYVKGKPRFDSDFRVDSAMDVDTFIFTVPYNF